VATSTRRWPAVAALTLAVVLSGCANSERDDVAGVATAFEDPSVAAADRCALLVPATLTALESDESAPCADALPAVPLPGGDVRTVEVWGGHAQVRLTGDTLFLTETGAGWRVAAAGCRSQGKEPYDCEVEGP
jgi:hypothetical protein